MSETSRRASVGDGGSELRQEASGPKLLKVVEFPLEGGGSVLVEVDEPLAAERPDRGPTRGLRQPADLTVSASETFQAALARIQPAAGAVVGRLRGLVDPPDEIELEFGVQLSAEFGAVVAKAAADANFRIRMRWSAAPRAPEAP